jgi:hypothetical protein
VNAGFLCTKAAMLNAVIKAKPCRKNHYQYHFSTHNVKVSCSSEQLQQHSFLISELDGGKQLVLHSGHFTPGGRTLSAWVGKVAPSTGLDIMEQRKLPCPNEGLSSSNYKSMFT